MVEIREARPDEYEAVGAITVAAYQALPGLERLGRYGDELADIAGRAPGIIMVAVDDDGTLLGDVTYYTSYGVEMEQHTDELADIAGFRMLATVPEAQGRGIGQQLTQWCIDRAKADGAKALALHTTDYMQAAQRLYVRLGFERWPELDHHIGRRNPVHVMAFRLDF